MTSRDYRKIADVIREQAETVHNHGELTATRNIARGLADLLASDNPRFKRDQFLSACGLPNLGRS